MVIAMHKSTLVLVASIIVAVTTATGLLTLGFAVTAAMHGQNLAELYLETFPRVRGVPVPLHLQSIAYAVFFLYVVGAAQIAVICRRRFNDAVDGKPHRGTRPGRSPESRPGATGNRSRADRQG